MLKWIQIKPLLTKLISKTPYYSFSKKKQKQTKKEKQYHESLKSNTNTFFKKFRHEYGIDDTTIFQQFQTSSFYRYMNENYRQLPFLFDFSKILKFRAKFQDETDYQDTVSEWFSLSESERMDFCKNLPYGDKMSLKKISILKPFLELYMAYLKENFPTELKISESLSTKSDLRMPHEWYPQARSKIRHIIYHHGPTNSGKTFSALRDLEKANKAIYCAPLRLLAWEIQEKLEDKGILCNLITGQESIIRENSNHTSCTIETASLNETYDIGIIDEIQMIGNDERGAAWTNALLGLQAEKIHLCGDPRSLYLVNKLCQLTGDKLEEKKYDRFSRIFVEQSPFTLDELNEGDCIITFSTKKVHQMKSKINSYSEDMHNNCAVVYGRLPPETRKDQARKFNDPESNIKYLVATNAIGMGVNLKIKRIIFQSLMRRDSEGNIITIDEHEIRQIAGRAGRFKQDGYVSCMNYKDLALVRRAMRDVNKQLRDKKNNDKDMILEEEKERYNEISLDEIKRLEIDIDINDDNGSIYSKIIKEKRIDEIKVLSFSDEEDEDNNNDDIKDKKGKGLNRIFSEEEKNISKAGLFPSFHQIEAFSKDLEKYERTKSSLSEIFKKFVSIAQIEGDYFIQKFDDFCDIADMIEDYNLSLRDQYIFSSAPLHLTDQWVKARKCMKNFACSFMRYGKVLIPDFIIDKSSSLYQTHSFEDLNALEEAHHILDLYIWLGNKYNSAFIEFEKAKEIKEILCQRIESILEKTYNNQYKKSYNISFPKRKF